MIPATEVHDIYVFSVDGSMHIGLMFSVYGCRLFQMK